MKNLSKLSSTLCNKLSVVNRRLLYDVFVDVDKFDKKSFSLEAVAGHHPPSLLNTSTDIKRLKSKRNKTTKR